MYLLGYMVAEKMNYKIGNNGNKKKKNITIYITS